MARNTNVASSRSGGQSSEVDLQSCFPWNSSKGQSFSSSIPASRKHLHPLACGSLPVSSEPALSNLFTLCLCSSFTLSYLPVLLWTSSGPIRFPILCVCGLGNFQDLFLTFQTTVDVMVQEFFINYNEYLGTPRTSSMKKKSCFSVLRNVVEMLFPCYPLHIFLSF